MSEYKERNTDTLGSHYEKHVNAMTSEGLHSKSKIAAELAYRDAQIEEMQSLINRVADYANWSGFDCIESMLASDPEHPSPVAHALEYAMRIDVDDGITFLRCWFAGDFEACRNEWEDVPDEVFIGADPTFKVSQI